MHLYVVSYISFICVLIEVHLAYGHKHEVNWNIQRFYMHERRNVGNDKKHKRETFYILNTSVLSEISSRATWEEDEVDRMKGRNKQWLTSDEHCVISSSNHYDENSCGHQLDVKILHRVFETTSTSSRCSYTRCHPSSH